MSTKSFHTGATKALQDAGYYPLKRSDFYGDSEGKVLLPHDWDYQHPDNGVRLASNQSGAHNWRSAFESGLAKLRLSED